MPGKTPGPFPSYMDLHHIDAAHIRADAEAPGLHAGTLTMLVADLGHDADTVRGQVDGDVRDGLIAAVLPRRRDADRLAGNGLFAVGLLKDWANDVDTFDLGVDGLNSRWATIVGQRITSEPQRALLSADYATLVGALDDAAQRIATRFAKGPTDAEVRRLIREGLIPLTAAHLYPSLTLTASDTYFAMAAAGATGLTPPAGVTPEQVMAWWTGLGTGGQAQLITANPEFVGTTDGIPAADRDTANRARLPDLIKEKAAYVAAHPDDKGAAEDLAGLRRLTNLLYGDDVTGPHPERQLLLLDDSGHPLKAAISNGDVDSADIVTTWIGGTTSTVDGFGGDIVRLDNQSAEVRRQLLATGDPRTQVGILWLGYDAPDNIVDPGRMDDARAEARWGWKDFIPGQHHLSDAWDILLRDGGRTQDAINTTFAREGAAPLASFADGIRATNPHATQTASAHSYGGAVLGGATQLTDAYDTVVLSGAPGAFAEKASDLHARHVYVSEAQWGDQDYSGVIGPGGPDLREVIDLVKDGGDFVPDIGHLDHRFGADPSTMPGVVNFDDGAADVDRRHLTAAHGHSSYWDQGGHALFNEANAIIGRPDRVSTR